MKKTILATMIILSMAMAMQEGEKVIEIRKIDWMRINLTAMYNGYFCGDKKAYINIYSTSDDKNTLRIYVYIKKGADKGYYMGQAKKMMSNERENMKAYWLNFTYVEREI